MSTKPIVSKMWLVVFYCGLISCISNKGKTQAGKDPIQNLDTLLPLGQMPQTKMSLTDTTIEFGRVDEGEILSVRLPIKNMGIQPLFIKDILKPCGCIGTKVDSKIVVPDSTTYLTIKFNTMNKVGVNRSKIKLYSNAGIHNIELKSLVEKAE